ncbi:MAG: hypothetical protein KKA07_15905 [Bacteroidetes bacterium]|nr:hypothetical protein [Bacteroidota bacterium]MBU1720548.1 hypothetical protein [Bacteroidota bacterium]
MKMGRKEFESILTVKIQDLLSLIIDTRKLSFDEALVFLYKSKLYEALSDEETKLWHLSSQLLLEMLETEKQTNELIYPDFV